MESYQDVINKDWDELVGLLNSIDNLIESTENIKNKITKVIYENISDSEQKAIFKGETYHYEARLVCLAGFIEYFQFSNMFLRSFLVITDESKKKEISLDDRYKDVYCKMENKHWILPEPNAFIRRIVIGIRAQLLSMPHAQLDELFKQLSDKLSNQSKKISQFSKTLPFVLKELWPSDQEKQIKVQAAFKIKGLYQIT